MMKDGFPSHIDPSQLIDFFTSGIYGLDLFVAAECTRLYMNAEPKEREK